MAMMAKQRSIKLILNELLGSSGNSLLIVPSSWVCNVDEPCCFWTLAQRVAERNAVLIGYQENGDAKKTFLNPRNKHEEASNWEDYHLAIVAGSRPVPGFHIPELEHAEVTDFNGRASFTPDEVVGGGLKGHASLDWQGDDEAQKTGQGGNGFSEAWNGIERQAYRAGNAVGTASSVMAMLAANYGPRMTQKEQQQFGATLEEIGDLIIKGKLHAPKKKDKSPPQPPPAPKTPTSPKDESPTNGHLRHKSPQIPWSAQAKEKRSKSPQQLGTPQPSLRSKSPQLVQQERRENVSEDKV